MSQALVHRGPDGSGEVCSERMAMAMRRLSIIDVTSGWQPLYDEDRTLALICNGEIYNYVELREQLKARGHTFRTGSDCEVILHLYQERGPQCVHELRGMFAFALWDSREKTLFLARDRMGEKPLYLYQDDRRLVFASELKALLESQAVSFQLDPIAIDQYFHYYYIPEPLTPIKGVRKLRAGHYLKVKLDPWSIEETCYWRMEDAPPIEGDPVQLIRAELENISALTIRSDVPVGIALSGGLDSSALAALAVRKYPGVMHAFSVGYPGKHPFDERAAAAKLAEHLGMPFHEVLVTPDLVLESLPEIIRWQDDPMADLSSYGYWAVAKAAREHGVPVLLQGQGGDELFWGYHWVVEAFHQSQRKASLNSKPPRFKDHLELSWPKGGARRAPLDWTLSLAGLRTSWENYQRDRLTPRDRLVFYELVQQFRIAEKNKTKVYADAFQGAVAQSSAADRFTLPRPWSGLDVTMTRLICETYLQENGIARGDRLSMASSVELRLPLVDYRLVETVIGLRKVRSDVGLPPKTWLREAISDIVPEFVRKRPKRGFQGPARDWHGPLFRKYGHVLEDGALVQLGVLKPEAARRFGSGSYPLTQVESPSLPALALELWCRQWT